MSKISAIDRFKNKNTKTLEPQEEKKDSQQDLSNLLAMLGLDNPGSEQPVETTSFAYKVVNGNDDFPKIEFKVDEYDNRCLTSLANMLVQMSQENFVFTLLTHIEQGFSEQDLGKEFVFLLMKYEELLDKYKEEEKEVRQKLEDNERPCIEPDQLI